MSDSLSGTFRVRPPVVSDKSMWSGLWSQYNAFYGRIGETALSTEVVDTTWNRLLDPDNPVCGLVAEGDEIMLGIVHVVFHENLIQIRQTCYMQDLFTTPQARGLGVARALIDGVADMCKTRNVLDVYWHTQSGNADARRLYDRLARDTDFVVYRMSLTI